MESNKNIYLNSIIFSVLGTICLLFAPMFSTESGGSYSFLKILSGTPEISGSVSSYAINILVLLGLIIVFVLYAIYGNDKIHTKLSKYFKSILKVLVVLIGIIYIIMHLTNSGHFNDTDNLYNEAVSLSYGVYLFVIILLATITLNSFDIKYKK